MPRLAPILLRRAAGQTLKHRNKRRRRAVTHVETNVLHAARRRLQRFDGCQKTQALAPLPKAHAQLTHEQPRQRTFADMRLLGPLPQRAVVPRLSLQGEFLLMEMDVVVAGVGEVHLRSQLELWDRLLQEFIVYLREYSQQAAQLQAQGEETEPAQAEESREEATAQ